MCERPPGGARLGPQVSTSGTTTGVVWQGGLQNGGQLTNLLTQGSWTFPRSCPGTAAHLSIPAWPLTHKGLGCRGVPLTLLLPDQGEPAPPWHLAVGSSRAPALNRSF